MTRIAGAFAATGLAAAAIAASAAFSPPAHALVLTYELNKHFGNVPASVVPTVTFDDMDSAGSVRMTIAMPAGPGVGAGEWMSRLFGNVGPAPQVLGTDLTFAYVSGVTGTVATGVDAFQAFDDGTFDFRIEFPLDADDPDRFLVGRESVWDITDVGGAITAASFNFFSAPDDGGSGPFILAARIRNTTGPLGRGGDWVGAIPIPGAAWLFVSALAGLGLLARRRTAAA